MGFLIYHKIYKPTTLKPLLNLHFPQPSQCFTAAVSVCICVYKCRAAVSVCMCVFTLFIAGVSVCMCVLTLFIAAVSECTWVCSMSSYPAATKIHLFPPQIAKLLATAILAWSDSSTCYNIRRTGFTCTFIKIGQYYLHSIAIRKLSWQFESIGFFSFLNLFSLSELQEAFIL